MCLKAHVNNILLSCFSTTPQKLWIDLRRLLVAVREMPEISDNLQEELYDWGQRYVYVKFLAFQNLLKYTMLYTHAILVLSERSLMTRILLRTFMYLSIIRIILLRNLAH